MSTSYLHLLIFVVISGLIGFVAIVLPTLLGPSRKNNAKLEPYESGIIPYADARRRFPIKYYIVAMLFILFDIEVIFMYPWAAVLRQLRDQYSAWVALLPMGFFLLVLVVGLIYEWKKGALDWE